MIIFNKTFWAILFSTLIFIILVSWFIARPLIFNTLKTYKKIGENKIQIKSLEEKLTVLKDLKKNQAKVSEIYQIADKFLPKEKKEGDFAIQLEDISNLSSLTLGSLNITTKTKETQKKEVEEEETKKTAKQTTTTTIQKEEKIAQMGFTTSFAAGWPSLLSFLTLLENGSRSNLLYSLNLNKGEGDLITTQIEGLFFYKPKITLSEELANIKISPETEKKFKDLGQYGGGIDLKQGFGRENPFSSF